MRHRFVCPLYNKHPKHQEVIDHLLQFAKTDRGRELALLVVAGYQSIYGRNPDASPQSISPDISDFLNQIAAIHKGAPTQQNTSSPLNSAPEVLQQADKTTSNNEDTVQDNKEQSKLEETKDKNKPKSSTRNLTPPSLSKKPEDGLLDEPPEGSDSSDDIVDPLTSIGKMFR